MFNAPLANKICPNCGVRYFDSMIHRLTAMDRRSTDDFDVGGDSVRGATRFYSMTRIPS